MKEFAHDPAAARAQEKKVSEEHPELHHYTNRAGLKGIYDSQSLWATSFECLNDPTEFLYAKEFFTDALTHRMETRLLNKVSSDTVAARARKEAEDCIAICYEASMFAGYEHNELFTFCFPHITSFCTHGQDREYVQRNGLLSQWRGYGDEAGFAIVLDTLQLESMLERELERYDYVAMRMFDVQYHTDASSIRDTFGIFLDRMAEFWFLPPSERRNDLGEEFDLFLSTAPRLKHGAFFEEREVRIVAFPVFQEYRDYRVRHSMGHPAKLIKPLIKGGMKPHIVLFEGDGAGLPIKRIIVGPSKNQKRDYEWLVDLVKGKIDVHASETPFRSFK